MDIEQVKKRNIIFKYNIAEWDLNIHLIMGSKYNYVVDTGLGSLSVEPVIAYLKNSRKPIIVINTHYHWDHIWGNNAFSDCTIISHKLCRELTSTKWDEMIGKKSQFMRGDVQIHLPSLIFEDMVYFPDDGIRVFHTPGHTIDSISVLDEEDGVINVGDNIGDSFDEIMPSLETSKDVYIKTLLKYKGLDFDTCVSGHNVTCGKDVFDTILKAFSQ